MNRYEKAVAQMEKKGNPVHSYVAVIEPLSKHAHKYFGTDEESSIAIINEFKQKHQTGDAQRKLERIKKAQSKLHMSYGFYYDDPSETEEERKDEVRVEAIKRLDRLNPFYWTGKGFNFKKDYDIEVMKVEK